MEMDQIHAYLMWRPWFSLRPVNVEFLVDTLATEQDFLRVLGFFPASIITLLHSYISALYHNATLS